MVQISKSTCLATRVSVTQISHSVYLTTHIEHWGLSVDENAFYFSLLFWIELSADFKSVSNSSHISVESHVSISVGSCTIWQRWILRSFYCDIIKISKVSGFDSFFHLKKTSNVIHILIDILFCFFSVYSICSNLSRKTEHFRNETKSNETNQIEMKSEHMDLKLFVTLNTRMIVINELNN